MAKSAGQECKCQYIHTPAIGTYDTVTNEWLSDTVTTHVTSVPMADCPMHGVSATFARYLGQDE